MHEKISAFERKFWDFPLLLSKRLLVLITSYEVFSMSSAQQFFVLKTSPKTSWRRLGRRKIVTLKTCLEDALKTRLEGHVLKTSWRHVLKTSSRHLADKQNFCWRYLYLTNLNVYLTNLYLTNLYLANLRWIQNALIRTQ